MVWQNMKTIIKIDYSLKDFHDFIFDLREDLRSKNIKVQRNRPGCIIINDYQIIYISDRTPSYMGLKNFDYLMCRDKDIQEYLFCHNQNIKLIKSYNELVKLICGE